MSSRWRDEHGALQSPAMLDVAKIKALREQRGLSQAQAARAAGLANRQKWCDIEAGRRPDMMLSTLGRIADALAVRPAGAAASGYTRATCAETS